MVGGHRPPLQKTRRAASNLRPPFFCSGVCSFVDVYWLAAAAPPKTLVPSALVMVALPTRKELSLFARLPVTLTVSPIFSVSGRHPDRYRELGAPPSTWKTTVFPVEGSFASMSV